MADRDADKFTNDLTVAISRLNEANTGLIKSFGEAGEGGNKLWNVISRFSSGSTFWRLQNYLRGVSNIVQAFTNANEENQKAILNSMEANLGLADSLKTLQQQRAKLRKEDDNALYRLFVQDLGDAELAKETADKFYTTQINALQKVAKKRGKQFRKSLMPGIRKRYAEASDMFFEPVGKYGMGSGQMERKPLMKSINFIAEETFAPLTKAFGKTKDFFFDKGPLGRIRNDGSPDMRFKINKEIASGLKKMMAKMKKVDFIGKLGEFATITTAALGKFLLYGLLIVLGITVLAAIIKKGWPVLTKQFSGAFKFFKAAFMNVIGIIKGVFKLFQAIFAGDVLGALEIFFKDIFLNVVKLIANVLAGLFKVLVGVIGALLSGIYKNTIGRLPGFSTGGVSMGGPALVGERGSELVNLPRGARISNNANSMGTRAGGNNIHVHINGRVGASDAEIRDIANKVAREINIRMNRTGANRIGA